MESSKCIGIYVHIPYCTRRCLYCDFYTEGAVRAEWPRYVNAVLNEFSLRLRNEEGEIFRGCDCYTLYVGGGTPSLIPAGAFMQLSEGLQKMAGGKPSEFTIEVNPDDVDEQLANVWAASGVDRVSMGVQSLCDSELKAIGRRHDAFTARKSYDVLRERFGNISLDMMFGLPGQSPESLAHTVEEFIEMNPGHISAYSLMYEERTALTRLRDTGRVQETDEQDCVGMFRSISESLERAGYEQYEISNYAIPGHRSLHNSNYWRGLPYIGLGAGAHSFNGVSLRTWNRPDAKSYMECMENERRDHSMTYTEELTDDELREEMIMTRLRTREGLDLKDYGERFGLSSLVSLTQRAKPIVARGLLRTDGQRLALTKDGVMVSDDIISDLF